MTIHMPWGMKQEEREPDMEGKRYSNYDIMRDRMELEFAKYDQTAMIQKFSLQPVSPV